MKFFSRQRGAIRRSKEFQEELYAWTGLLPPTKRLIGEQPYQPRQKLIRQIGDLQDERAIFMAALARLLIGFADQAPPCDACDVCIPIILQHDRGVAQANINAALNHVAACERFRDVCP